jgi:hypothetical protein
MVLVVGNTSIRGACWRLRISSEESHGSKRMLCKGSSNIEWIKMYRG